MIWKKIRSGLSTINKYRNFSVFILVFFYQDILEFITQIPDSLIISATLISVIWMSSYNFFERVPSIRLWVIPLSFLGCMHLMNYLLKSNMYIANDGLFVSLGSFVGGIILFFILFFVFNGVAMSIAGYKIDDIRKKRRERIDDPYGDKHAQKILNE